MYLFRLFSLLGILYFTGIAPTTAQNNVLPHCGDDVLKTLMQQNTPGYERQTAESNRIVSEYARNMLRNGSKPLFQRNTENPSDSIYYIPVVVHVVYPAGTAYGSGTNISYPQIRSQIEALNAAFSKNYPAYNGQTHPGYAQDANIRFCLARTATDNSAWATGPGGVEYGVKRYADNTTAYDHFISVASANHLLGITHPNPANFPFGKYLNIWVVRSINGGDNTIGYAPTPIMPGYPLDGIVMRADVFGDNTTGGNYPLSFGLTQGKILAHEAGHYLNLYHIFQGGCAGANAAGSVTDACDLNGDMICDIEPSVTQNIFCSAPVPNTCAANYNTGTTSLDMVNDYMSYADDDCMNTFTANQCSRMWATLNLYRQTLWQPQNLQATGILGGNGCIPPYLNAQIFIPDPVLCINKPVTFSNPTAGNTATTRLWQFTGANIATSTANPVTVTYTTPGVYKVILQVSDGATTRKDSVMVTVNECRLDSAMLGMSHWYFGNYGSISFSAGAPVQTNTALANQTIHGEPAYPGQQPFIHASVSQSDSLGNLLFYSNAVSVWNKNHQKISTGPIFGVSDNNASSGTNSTPWPGQPGKYFVSSVYPNFDGSPSGIRFVVVDVVANTVSAYQEFQHPQLPNRFSQYSTVIPHCNGTDYWLIFHGHGTDTRFFSFLVTQTGISATQQPVISAGFTQQGYGGDGYQLKSNRLGNRLILSSPAVSGFGASLYEFDSRTGEVKNERKLPNVAGYNNIQTGCAFSPNGAYVYILRSSNLTTNGLPYWLFQYDVTDLRYNIFSAPGFYFAASMQPGPDNNLYITTQEHFFVQVTNTDVWGDVRFNGSFINMRLLNDSVRTSICIPAFIDARRQIPTHPEFTTTPLSCSAYRFTSLCFDNYTASWNFGDGSPVQTGNTIVHNYTQPGTYTVTLTLSQGGTVFGSTIKTVIILGLSGNITGPNNICSNGLYPNQYYAPIIANASYNWNVIGGNITGPANLPFADVVWYGTVTTGTLQLTITREACIITLLKTVQITRGPGFSWSLRDSVCVTDSFLNLTATPAGGAYSGRGIVNNRFYPSTAGLGDHLLVYSYSDEATCLGQIEKRIKVINCNIPVTGDTDCEQVFRSLQISPNPVPGVLQIKSPYSLSLVHIYDMAGRKMATGRLNGNRYTLPPLAAGMYAAAIFCEKDMSYRTLIFIKQ